MILGSSCEVPPHCAAHMARSGCTGLSMAENSMLSDRRFAIMLFLRAPGATGRENEPVDGITRLQKEMFLLWKEDDILKRLSKIDFAAYAFGPYDAKIYDDLAFLANVGFLAGSEDIGTEDLFENVSRSMESESAVKEAIEFEMEGVSFDYLMSGIDTSLPDRYTTRRYQLSSKGLSEVARRIGPGPIDKSLSTLLDAFERVKTRWNRASLRDLIRYVYGKYPEFATESVIADKIL